MPKFCNKNSKNTPKYNKPLEGVDFVLPPHQNLSEWGVLEVRNSTHKLLLGFWLSLGGKGSEEPRSQEEQEPHQNLH